MPETGHFLQGDQSQRERLRHHGDPQWWVFFGGAALAGTAGYVNAVLIDLYHVAVSHMSGAVSLLGVGIAHGEAGELERIANLVAGFVGGAVLSGLIIGGTTLRPGRRYGVALMVEGALLALGCWRTTRGDLDGLTFAACACGLQNGMASSYLGLILRTTHVTGILTDLGVQIGHLLRHRRVEGWKLLLLLDILGGFLLGGILGAALDRRLGQHALWLAAGGTFTAGLAYYAWRVLGRGEDRQRG